jgi:acyl-CoA reductase-like NAD-dependent aldehyde dehydrogenase
MELRRLIIGSDRIETSDTFDVVNPFTQQPIASVALGNASTLDQAIAAADSAFAKTRALPAHRRAEILLAAAAGIARRKNEFAQLMIAEAGKPITLAEAEVDRAVITFTAAAEEARRVNGQLLDADAFAPGDGYFSLVRRFPVGVIYGIPPFNFPLNLVAHKVAPAIASGNTIVIKPSPRTPLCSLLLGEVLLEAGIVPGQVNIVTCPNNLAERPLLDNRVKHVSFTGSAAVGWKLRDKAGHRAITLELGGSAAVIIDHNADRAAAAAAVATGAFGYAGQSCISVQRVFVHRNIYEAFAGELFDFIRDKIRTGDPSRREILNGPMIDHAALERVEAAVNQARDAGALITAGGQPDGPCYRPTVIEQAASTLDVNAQELFGPVMTMRSFADFDDAIAMANDSRYGLQAGVFTRDIERAMHAFETLEVGGVVINQVPTFRLDNLPYGGVKDSGLGREGLRSAIEAMTEPRTLIMKMT